MSPAELERALFHWAAIIDGLPEGSWERGFALSVRRRARDPRWRPSPKQAAVIRALMAELFAPASREGQLIERENFAA